MFPAHLRTDPKKLSPCNLVPALEFSFMYGIVVSTLSLNYPILSYPYDISLMFMTYLMSYVLYLIHLMYFSLMLGRVMLTCDSFALVGWTSTPKGGYK